MKATLIVLTTVLFESLGYHIRPTLLVLVVDVVADTRTVNGTKVV